MDVVNYFTHMEKVIYGTAFITEEYPEQFGRTARATKKRSAGTTCTYCKTGIPADVHENANTLDCPCCGKTFIVAIKYLQQRTQSAH